MAVERKESLCAGTGKSLGFYARIPKEAITGLKAIDAEKHTISEATWRVAILGSRYWKTFSCRFVT